MARKNNKHERRVKRFIVGTGLFTVLLATSTYAWFIGMKTVDVSPFDVKIATTESLLLSNFSVELISDDYEGTAKISKTNSTQ